MIHVFDKHHEHLRQIPRWDPALVPNYGYVLDARGRWFHMRLSRLMRLESWDLTPKLKAAGLLLGVQS